MQESRLPGSVGIPPILKVTDLAKSYKHLTVVDRISFQVEEGEVVGLLGPNGAGKTTTIHMLLSLVKPSGGSIQIFGQELAKDREGILARMNFAAGYAALPYNLSVYENLNIFSLLYGIPDRRAKIEQLLQEFQLTRFRKQRTGALSSGEQTRVGLAKAFLNDPKLLLLDEPTASLDPSIARDLRALVRNKMRAVQGAILWTSHNMQEIERVCDRIIILKQGRIVAQGTLEQLRRQFEQDDLEEIFVALMALPEPAMEQTERPR
ncbi:MAG: ABC transporter ATP-binding protein [SAR202 cluster bacterium]|nr:ABC transporter ATP-binding protein [SAR202 cluster bacterium]